jgi:uncharacterized protein DUF4041/Meiotically Up-regulated Gene 113 (MUG113) protein
MSLIITFFIVLLIIAGVIASLVLLIQRNSRLAKLVERYEPIIDAEKESLNIRNQALKEAGNIRNSTTTELEDIRKYASDDLTQIISLNEKAEKNLEKITSQIASLQSQKKQLQHGVDLLEEKDLLYSQGLYEPHYDFEKLIDYERQIVTVRKKQKLKIKEEEAIKYSAIMKNAESTRAIKNFMKVILRAFNSECDFLISKVNYKNVVVFEKRIEKSYDQINKLSSSLAIEITKEYMNLKIKELQIVHEFEEKKEEEAEKQRQIKEIMRDELKAERELEKAQQEAEKEERIYESALNKALAEAQTATGKKQEVLQGKIALLQAQLEEALEKKERAISRAQQTKSGHVYVISNIGSFGEDIYKIGMTRRLEPLDRVKELSSASVPFEFDVHAVIYSSNAPELENNLHKACDIYRLNRVNARKEFFKIDIDKIEEFAKQHDPGICFSKVPEAKDYRTSVMIEKAS